MESSTLDIAERDNLEEAGTKVRRAGYLLVVIFLVVVGGWTACAPLESAALAPGLVQVEGKRKPIQHLEGGIVARILVSNGDSVAPNQPLVILDATGTDR